MVQLTVILSRITNTLLSKILKYNYMFVIVRGFFMSNRIINLIHIINN
jgi:hypothetical protein